jgi:hypothetical protein
MCFISGALPRPLTSAGVSVPSHYLSKTSWLLSACRAFRHAGDDGRVRALQPLLATTDVDILAGQILIMCQ